MIYRIYSNLPTFKELHFHQGLNVILADKSPGATEKQTRNGAGKSSLTELIHFLMGAIPDSSSPWRTDALSQYSFGMAFDLGQVRTQVERSGDTSKKSLYRKPIQKIGQSNQIAIDRQEYYLSPIAKALQIGERTARDLNFQYIVTMNSDAVPHEFPDNFNLKKYTLPIHLTDATENGGLFGVRF